MDSMQIHPLQPPALDGLPEFVILGAESDSLAFRAFRDLVESISGNGLADLAQMIGRKYTVMIARSGKDVREMANDDPFVTFNAFKVGDKGRTITGSRSIRTVPLLQTEAILPTEVGRTGETGADGAGPADDARMGGYDDDEDAEERTIEDSIDASYAELFSKMQETLEVSEGDPDPDKSFASCVVMSLCLMASMGLRPEDIPVEHFLALVGKASRGISANEEIMVFANYLINILAKNVGPTSGNQTTKYHSYANKRAFNNCVICSNGEKLLHSGLALPARSKAAHQITSLMDKGSALQQVMFSYFRSLLSDESHFISTFAMKTLDLIRFAHATHLQQVNEVALQEFPVVFEHVSGRVTGERLLVSMKDHGVQNSIDMYPFSRFLRTPGYELTSTKNLGAIGAATFQYCRRRDDRWADFATVEYTSSDRDVEDVMRIIMHSKPSPLEGSVDAGVSIQVGSHKQDLSETDDQIASRAAELLKA